MERSRVVELHFLTPSANLASIFRFGILSHRAVASLPHQSVAMEQVQDLRAGKQVPNGLHLHEYANLYFDARNPMMYKRQDQCETLAVVRVSPEVLDLDGVVITDGNAASHGTKFMQSPNGLTELDESRVYARYWTDSDYWTYVEKKRARCAEVLVPNRVHPRYITGVYACSEGSKQVCLTLTGGTAVEVNVDVFFS